MERRSASSGGRSASGGVPLAASRSRTEAKGGGPSGRRGGTRRRIRGDGDTPTCGEGWSAAFFFPFFLFGKSGCPAEESPERARTRRGAWGVSKERIPASSSEGGCKMTPGTFSARAAASSMGIRMDEGERISESSLPKRAGDSEEERKCGTARPAGSGKSTEVSAPRWSNESTSEGGEDSRTTE